MSDFLRRRVPRGDSGSMILLVLVFVLIVVLMIVGTTAATSAFIAQRDLQSNCDSAATWAAAEVSVGDVYGDEVASKEFLPLSPEAVAAAVEEHRARFYPGEPELTMVARSDGEQLTVVCHNKVKVPFGAFFGKGDGVERDAESAVRSPISTPTTEASIVDN